MNVLMGVLILCLSFPPSVCKADVAVFHATSNAYLHTGILKKQNLRPAPNPDVVEISYGFANVKLFTHRIPEVNINHPAQVKTGISFSFVGTVEAAVSPDEFKINDFEKICNTISDAGRLDDLKPVLFDQNLAFLKAKVNAGVSQYVVLAMLQAMRPQKIRIIDFRVEEGRAEFAVAGKSLWGPLQGLIHMVKVEGAWKIKDENWYAGKDPGQRDGPVVMVFNSLSDAGQYIYPGPRGLVPEISSDDVVRKGSLQLTKVTDNRRKRAFMFVFLMDKDKVDPNQSAVVKDNPRTRMHILGSRKMFPEQKVIENKYPVDISLAKYGDGYAPQEWNLVLPNGKPHEVTVSWMWSF